MQEYPRPWLQMVRYILQGKEGRKEEGRCLKMITSRKKWRQESEKDCFKEKNQSKKVRKQLLLRQKTEIKVSIYLSQYCTSDHHPAASDAGGSPSPGPQCPWWGTGPPRGFPTWRLTASSHPESYQKCFRSHLWCSATACELPTQQCAHILKCCSN